MYQDANVLDTALCGLRDKVTVEFVKGWPKMQSEAIVELTTGRKLRAKFLRLAQPVLGNERTGEILHLVDALERTSVADLMEACAAARQV